VIHRSAVPAQSHRIVVHLTLDFVDDANESDPTSILSDAIRKPWSSAALRAHGIVRDFHAEMHVAILFIEYVD